MAAVRGVTASCRPNIYIVSADPTFRRLCRRHWPAAAVHDPGDYALRDIAHARPDVILYDLVHSDEWDEVARLRELASANDVPMIVLTSWVWADGFSRRRARELRCTAILRKPCSVTGFLLPGQQGKTA